MGENHFAYLWFEKYHLTYLWYVSVNLCNPPQAQSLQKHFLTPKHNITRIKIPKTQKLFERETCGEINVFFMVWSVWRGRKHKFLAINGLWLSIWWFCVTICGFCWFLYLGLLYFFCRNHDGQWLLVDLIMGSQ